MKRSKGLPWMSVHCQVPIEKQISCQCCWQLQLVTKASNYWYPPVAHRFQQNLRLISHFSLHEKIQLLLGLQNIGGLRSFQGKLKWYQPHLQLHHQRQQVYLLQHILSPNKLCTQQSLLWGAHPWQVLQLGRSSLLLPPLDLQRLKPCESHVPLNPLEIWCLHHNTDFRCCSIELQLSCCEISAVLWVFIRIGTLRRLYQRLLTCCRWSYSQFGMFLSILLVGGQSLHRWSSPILARFLQN